MTGLHIATGFPGANPRGMGHVRENPDKSFTVFPEHEPETPPGYRFRLDVDVVNQGNAPEQTVLRIVWDDARYMALRQRIYIRHGASGFFPVLGRPGQGTTEAVFCFPALPGVTQVCLLPRYGREDVLALIDCCAGFPGFSLREYPMDHGPLHVLCFRKGRSRPALLVTGRIHPYETAGSFCVDAMARAVCLDHDYRNRLLSRFDLLFAPVMSPAGVALGFCRKNGASGEGIDLARQWSHNDPVCRAVAGLASERTIAGLFDVHNWMHEGADGIKFANLWEAARFKSGIDGHAGKKRRFKGIFRKRFFAHSPLGIAGYLKSRGAFCLMVEYPWAGRDARAMADLGKQSLPAFARLVGK